MTTVYLLIDDINPTPWMAPELSVGRGKGGKAYPMAHSPEAMRAYQHAIREACAMAYPEHEPFPKGTPLSAFFYFWRKQDQYKTTTGRNQTAKRADATNMTKSTEDALAFPIGKGAHVGGEWCLYMNDVDNRISAGVVVEQSVDTEPTLMVVVTTAPSKTLLDSTWIRVAREAIEEQITPPNPPGNVRLKVSAT